MHNRDDEEFIVKQQANILEDEITEYLKRHPVEDKPRVQHGAWFETPKLRFRSRGSKVDPGWTRKCEHCWTVQYPINGAFATFYHKCGVVGAYIEWPPSIGRDYA